MISDEQRICEEDSVHFLVLQMRGKDFVYTCRDMLYIIALYILGNPQSTILVRMSSVLKMTELEIPARGKKSHPSYFFDDLELFGILARI